MRLLLVNANTTVSMTRDIEAVARRVAGVDTIVEAVNPTDGPASVEMMRTNAAGSPRFSVSRSPN